VLNIQKEIIFVQDGARYVREGKKYHPLYFLQMVINE
jgi:hypothetical protein